MPKSNIKIGASGEKSAGLFLESQGYVIYENNYRTRFCEIDIIAREMDTLCFIEVKTRQSLKKGLPRESVNFSKQKKIIQGALYYLKEKKIHDQRLRFDVVEVFIKTDQAPRINLIRNAFQAG